MISLLIIAAIGQSCIAAQQQVAYQPVQYQANYAQQAYVEKVVFVAVEAQDASAYYGGLVGQAQRTVERQAQAQQATASADAKIDQLTRAIEALQKRLEAQASEPALPTHPGQAPAPPVPSLSPVSSEAVPPPPTIAQASTALAVGARNGPGLALLSAKCAGCHSGESAKGAGHRLFTADGRFVVQDREGLERIEQSIASRRMPKGPQKLTLRESANILNFLDAQAAQLAVNTINQRKKPL